jgi:hypothetical protein
MSGLQYSLVDVCPNESLYNRSSVGNGIHNFDFRKPVRIVPQENPVGALHAIEDQK